MPGVEAGVTPESISVTQLLSIFSEVNRNLAEYVLASLNPENNYFIASDQLDLGLDRTNEEYADRIMGLLLASRDINLLSKKHGKHFLAVIFLRDGIYDGLHFDDPALRR